MLFLFGILIQKLELDREFNSINSKHEISFNIRFSDFMNVDIVLEDLLTDQERKDTIPTVKEDIEINMGKTYLFSSSFKDVTSEMRKSPLELSLCLMRKREGIIFHRWKQEFINLLKTVEAGGDVRSFHFSLTEKFRNETDKVIGSCDFLIQFSCFGHSLQNSFNIKIETDYDLYLNACTKKTFKCQNLEKLISAKAEIPLLTVSWPSLMGAKEDTLSFKGFDEEELLAEILTNPTLEDRESEVLEVVSLCFRPPEKKYFDLLDMISADVTTTPKGTCITLTVDKQTKPKTKSPDLSESRSKTNPFDSAEDRINKKLCKGKDCPAALKLKHFGYGPLATGKGVGTMYRDVKSSISYGMSQTYGTFSRYGPYGVLVDNDVAVNQEAIIKELEYDLKYKKAEHLLVKESAGSVEKQENSILLS